MARLAGDAGVSPVQEICEKGFGNRQFQSQLRGQLHEQHAKLVLKQAGLVDERRHFRGAVGELALMRDLLWAPLPRIENRRARFPASAPRSSVGVAGENELLISTTENWVA